METINTTKHISDNITNITDNSNFKKRIVIEREKQTGLVLTNGRQVKKALQFFKQVVVIHVLLQVGVADPSLVPIRPALVLMDAQILAEQDGLAAVRALTLSSMPPGFSREPQLSKMSLGFGVLLSSSFRSAGK